MSDFKAKIHQNLFFGWGSALDPFGEAYTAPDPQAGMGLLLREGKGCREEKGVDEGREEREEKGRKGRIIGS